MNNTIVGNTLNTDTPDSGGVSLGAAGTVKNNIISGNSSDNDAPDIHGTGGTLTLGVSMAGRSPGTGHSWRGARL